MTTCFLGSYFKTFFCYSQTNHVISSIVFILSSKLLLPLQKFMNMKIYDKKLYANVDYLVV